MVAGSLWGGGESRKDLRGSLVYLDPRAHRERSGRGVFSGRQVGAALDSWFSPHRLPLAWMVVSVFPRLKTHGVRTPWS